MRRFFKPALIVAALLATAACPATASACDNSNTGHCYSIGGIFPPTSGNYVLPEGANADIATCAMAGINPYQAVENNELWMYDADEVHWIEAGVHYGEGYNTLTAGSPTLMWADYSSAYGFSDHLVTPPYPPVGTVVKVRIRHSSGHWWHVWFTQGSWTSPTYSSWQDSSSAGHLETGLEFTADNAYEQGDTSNLDWVDGSGNLLNPTGMYVGQKVNGGAIGGFTGYFRWHEAVGTGFNPYCP